MKAQDVINQLSAALPLFTSDFSTTLSVTGLVVSSNVATVTTTADHGLTTNDIVIVKNAITPNPITSLTRVGNVATAITANNHSLTKQTRGQQLVTISGANEGDYNGSKALIDILSSTSFTYKVANNPTTPATGSPILEEFFLNSDEDGGFSSINGAHQIIVTGTTTFTYVTNTVPDVTAIGTIQVEKSPRISGAVSLERAVESYTRQSPDQLWGFVVLEDRTANKDRNINIDATSSKSAGADSRQIIISPFTFYVIVPTSNQLSARAARDKMEDLMSPLFQSLIGVRFTAGLACNDWAELTFLEHGFQDYVNAYYIHRFSFESVFDITFGDTAKSHQICSVFRCIDFSATASTASADTELATAVIDLNN